MGCELIFCIIFAYLYKREGHRHLALWSAALLCEAIGRLLYVVAPRNPPPPLLLGLSTALILTMAMMMLAGIHQMLGKPLHRGWWLAAAAAFVIPLALQPLGIDFTMALALPLLLCAVTFTYSGVSILRGSPDRGMGRLLSGGGLVALGVHTFTYPIAASDPVLLLIGTVIGGVVWVATLSGLVLLHFDRVLERGDASDAAYRELFLHASVGIARSSRAGRFLDANPALIRMLGYDSLEEVQALDLARDVYSSENERDKIRAETAHQPIVEDIDLIWRRRDGSPLYINLSGRKVRDESGALLFYEAFIRDVTDARLLAERLKQAEKLEAVGRLAGGVAHDFNNYLTVIRGNSILLRDSLNDEDREILADIVEATNRAATLTDQLLAFSRRRSQHLEVMDLSEVVRSSMGMLVPLLGERLQITLELATGAYVRADRNQVEHALLNLCVNARDAMVDGGALTIRTAVHGERVHMDVCDAGEGIPEHTLAHIFEPFFTTKGHGTGLGLSQVYGVVTQAGGDIDVISALGEGTTISLRFPICDAPPREHQPARAPREQRELRLLVVEDEPALMRTLERVLSLDGHELHLASDGAEALALLASIAPPDAMITALTMPGMDGVELTRRVRERHPDLPVLFMSGYPEQVTAAASLSSRRSAFLPKPFEIEALQQALETLLDRAGAAD